MVVPVRARGLFDLAPRCPHSKWWLRPSNKPCIRPTVSQPDTSRQGSVYGKSGTLWLEKRQACTPALQTLCHPVCKRLDLLFVVNCTGRAVRSLCSLLRLQRSEPSISAILFVSGLVSCRLQCLCLHGSHQKLISSHHHRVHRLFALLSCNTRTNMQAGRHAVRELFHLSPGRP